MAVSLHGSIYHAPPPQREERNRKESFTHHRTYPEIGSSKAVGGRHVGGGSGMCIVSVDVGEQGAHHRRHSGTHVFRGQAGKVAEREGMRG